MMVTRLDRLARSTRDLLNTLATITAKGAGFRSIHDAWADTTTAHGRLMLTVLGTGRPVKMGRKPKLTEHQKREAIRRRDKGEPMREIARTFNVSHSTISRLKA